MNVSTQVGRSTATNEWLYLLHGSAPQWSATQEHPIPYTRMYTTRKNEYVQFHFRNNLRMFRFKPKQFSLYFDRSFLDGSLQKSSNEFSESVLLNGLPTPGTILKQLKTGPFERNPNSITRV